MLSNFSEYNSSIYRLYIELAAAVVIEPDEVKVRRKPDTKLLPKVLLLTRNYTRTSAGAEVGGGITRTARYGDGTIW